MGSSKIQLYNLDDSVLSNETIVLSVSSWSNNSQTVVCNGVTTNNTVIISPAPASIDAYNKAEIKCISQDTNSLTFTCKKAPEIELTVNVLILGV